MTTEKRINALVKLGKRMLAEPSPGYNSKLSNAINGAHIYNPWFVPQNVELAIASIANQWLNREILESWIARYPYKKTASANSKNVGVIMAGNIPLVGFHDFMCVLLSGHRFMGKASSKDGGLMLTIANMLVEVEPELADQIVISDENLKGFDAVIATGSDNTSRYFEYYFRNCPTILRSHRNSIAVLTGHETKTDFENLGNDIFTYFGLGCRNISKLLVPENYGFKPLLDSFSDWKNLINHNKYANNYEYRRAIFSMNQIPHFDTGFVLVTPSEQIDSPVGTLFYQEYKNLSDVGEYININANKIQCVVGNSKVHPKAIPFGTTQTPAIDDYADGIDTVNFLLNL
ncbi:MAG: acyl-CoA reductase [Bacteroidales bacterium]